MNKSLRSVINDIIGKEHSDEFAEWAFGKNYNDLIGFEKFADAWNEKHGDLFKINVDNEMYPDLLKMTNIWKIVKEK